METAGVEFGLEGTGAGLSGAQSGAESGAEGGAESSARSTARCGHRVFPMPGTKAAQPIYNFIDFIMPERFDCYTSHPKTMASNTGADQTFHDNFQDTLLAVE